MEFVRIGIRPPLEKMLFPVQRPGESMRADLDPFFSFSTIFLFFNIIFTMFLPKKRKKKEKRFCGRPTGHNFTRCTGNKLFLKGGLIGLSVVPQLGAVRRGAVVVGEGGGEREFSIEAAEGRGS